MARQPISPEADAPEVKTVHMVRDAKHYPAPHTADVHPDEVAAYMLGGWHKAD